MSDSVSIGIRFEESVVNMLNTCGLEAYRTNKTNIHDPEGYKRGFDGGVDIIATYQTSIKKDRDFVFFIQCKCQKHPLEKSAISEVYAGMHVRKGFGDACIPVVIATCEASQETMQYAKELGVELIMREQMEIIKQAHETGKIPYVNYGTLMKVMLYHYTKDTIWLDTLPLVRNVLSEISMTEQLLEAAKVDFDKAQTYMDRADQMERRAREERQKALDIQKAVVLRSIQMNSSAHDRKETHVKKEKPTVVEDSG